MLNLRPSDQEVTSDFLQGVRDAFPGGEVLFVTFSIVSGSSIATGLSELQSVVLSMLMFAAPAQLALLELLREPVSLITICLTVLFVNLRFSLMSLSLVPYFKGRPLRKIILGLPMLSATTYALTYLKISEKKDRISEPESYFLGICLISYSFAIAGAFIGSGLFKSVPSKILHFMPMIACLFLASKLTEKGLNPKLVAGIAGFCATPVFKYFLGNYGFFVSGLLIGFIVHIRRSNDG